MNNKNPWLDKIHSFNFASSFANTSGMSPQNQESSGSSESSGNDAGRSNFPAIHGQFSTNIPAYAADFASRGETSLSNLQNYPLHTNSLPNLGDYTAAETSVSRSLTPSAIISPGNLLAHSASNRISALSPLNYASGNDTLPLAGLSAPASPRRPSRNQLPTTNQILPDLTPTNPTEFSKFSPKHPPAPEPSDKLASIPLSADDEVELARLQRERDELLQALESETKRIAELEAELAQNRMVWQDVEKRIQEEIFRLESIAEEHPVLKEKISELKNGKYATYRRDLSQGLIELSRNYWQYGLRDHGDLTTNFHTALNVIENALNAIDQLHLKRTGLESAIEQLVIRQHNLRVHLIDLIHDGSNPSPFHDIMEPSISSPRPSEPNDSHCNPD